MKPGILQLHPCPECFGNVPWHARSCPHCETRISNAIRFDWLSQPGKAGFFLGLMVLVFLAGCSLMMLAGWL